MRVRAPSPRAFRVPLGYAFAALLVLSSGCASHLGRYPGSGSGADRTSVALIGVGRRAGVAEELNGSVAARDLVARLADGDRRRVLEPRHVREALGGESWSALMARDAAGGSLGERDIRLLAAAGLGTRFALIVRIERDEVVALPPDRDLVRDEDGRVLRDRVRERHATRRETELSAELVDLEAPGSLWRRTFGADPTTRTENVRYRGSSFSGSVAARLANTMLNGPGGSGSPPPASLRRTLESLFDEIDLALPSN